MARPYDVNTWVLSWHMTLGALSLCSASTIVTAVSVPYDIWSGSLRWARPYICCRCTVPGWVGVFGVRSGSLVVAGVLGCGQDRTRTRTWILPKFSEFWRDGRPTFIFSGFYPGEKHPAPTLGFTKELVCRAENARKTAENPPRRRKPEKPMRKPRDNYRAGDP